MKRILFILMIYFISMSVLSSIISSLPIANPTNLFAQDLQVLNDSLNHQSKIAKEQADKKVQEPSIVTQLRQRNQIIEKAFIDVYLEKEDKTIEKTFMDFYLKNHEATYKNQMQLKIMEQMRQVIKELKECKSMKQVNAVFKKYNIDEVK